MWKINGRRRIPTEANHSNWVNDGKRRSFLEHSCTILNILRVKVTVTFFSTQRAIYFRPVAFEIWKTYLWFQFHDPFHIISGYPSKPQFENIHSENPEWSEIHQLRKTISSKKPALMNCQYLLCTHKSQYSLPNVGEISLTSVHDLEIATISSCECCMWRISKWNSSTPWKHIPSGNLT